MNSFGTANDKQSETFDSLWKQPPDELILETGEAHVWLVSVNSVAVCESEHIISSDERIRAERFHQLQHRTEYVIARICLRKILSKYTGIAPNLLRFKYNEYGKPFITNQTRSNLQFSLSHSNGVALFALTLDNKIGIDIEQINSSYVGADIAAKSLTEFELAHFKTLTSVEREHFFFSCWTRKEAFSKALGKGLIIDPNQLEIFFSMDKVYEKGELQNNKVWRRTFRRSFYDLPSINGYAAALMLESVGQTKIDCWKLSDFAQ
jgi:4'-phosphopantetheinyl transferase